MVQKVPIVSESALSNRYTCGNQWQQIEQKVQIELKRPNRVLAVWLHMKYGLVLNENLL